MEGANDDVVKAAQEGLDGRTCETCACCMVATNPANPAQKQAFCRKGPANHKEFRAEVPRIFNGQPVIKNGKPVMEMGMVSAFVYPVTDLRLTCFDGWRPKGTLPGDKSWEITGLIKNLGDGFKRLNADILKDSFPGMGADLPVDLTAEGFAKTSIDDTPKGD